ncbi:MAG: hypothetical protein RLZZ591_2686 [Pseudomonadota bacterium]|jgi:tRNA threonylcarbamoyladenosine biosynthesis protein TsaB
MNLIALDTSTDTLSVALVCKGSAAVLQHSGPGAAQASATLIPAMQRLMAQAGLAWSQLDAIVFGRGPGSFTGLRTACSVAQGLAFGADLPVLPVDTLLAVAEEARVQFHGLATAGMPLQVLAMLDARMDELYCAHYQCLAGAVGADVVWQAMGEALLSKPEQVVIPAGALLAGNVFAEYGERLPDQAAPRVTVLPTAAALLRLAPALLAAGQAVPPDLALPLYVRDKVAQTTQERADLKAAQGQRG